MFLMCSFAPNFATVSLLVLKAFLLKSSLVYVVVWENVAILPHNRTLRRLETSDRNKAQSSHQTPMKQIKTKRPKCQTDFKLIRNTTAHQELLENKQPMEYVNPKVNKENPTTIIRCYKTEQTCRNQLRSKKGQNNFKAF